MRTAEVRQQEIKAKRLTTSASSIFLTGALLLLVDVFFGSQALLYVGFVTLALHAIPEIIADVSVGRPNEHSRYTIHDPNNSKKRFLNLLQSIVFLAAGVIQAVAFFYSQRARERGEADKKSVDTYLLLNTIASGLWISTGLLIFSARRCFCMRCFSRSSEFCDAVGNTCWILSTIVLIVDAFILVMDFNAGFNQEALDRFFWNTIPIMWTVSGVFYLVADLQRLWSVRAVDVPADMSTTTPYTNFAEGAKV